MTDRQIKLEKIVNEINDMYGIGNGYVDEHTDVDKFILEFKYKFLVQYDLSHLLNSLNESDCKSYIEKFDEI